MWNVGLTATRVAVAVAAVAVVWAVGGAGHRRRLAGDGLRSRSSPPHRRPDPRRDRRVDGLTGRRWSPARRSPASPPRRSGSVARSSPRPRASSRGRARPGSSIRSVGSSRSRRFSLPASLSRGRQRSSLARCASRSSRPRRPRSAAEAAPSVRSKGSRDAREQPPRTGWRRGAPLARIVVVGVIAVVTLPVLGDIFNFDPDVHMQTGGARVGLVDDGAGPPAASPPLPQPSDSFEHPAQHGSAERRRLTRRHARDVCIAGRRG